jgi:type VI secretion system secreted protein VgrG
MATQKAKFLQTERPLKLTTPLGADALIISAISGREALSELFHFEVDAMWEDKNNPLNFESLLGKKVTIEVMSKTDKRHLSGIVTRVTQGELDKYFIRYRIVIEPQIWLLTRRVRSRMFQQMAVPDILKKVLEGMDVTDDIRGSFNPREYCVQYHESDFNFFSRLAEEEGIYYYFKHTADGHKLVLADTPLSHDDIPYSPKATYEESSGTEVEEDRVFEWRKEQDIRSGKYTAWDEHFQMPGKHLDATKSITDTVQVGQTQHKLAVAGNNTLEIYEFPGGYARRYDQRVSDIFADATRTAGIRMREEAAHSVLIQGRSRHAGFTAGEAFDLSGHFSDDGKYVLTSVEHKAKQPVHVEDETSFTYENRFECIPAALPYSPPRRAAAPSVRGVQLGTVVGPKGEEIYTDKFGRIKVQFRWDRDGANDSNSSCWMRVATHWAGKQWGAIHIPRVGQEVVIDFEEGNVDYP